MQWEVWLLEHSVEIISLLVSIAGFGGAVYYLRDINIEQMNFFKNSNNKVFNIDKMSADSIEASMNELKERSQEENLILSDGPRVDDQNLTDIQLLQKIEDFLDKEKSASNIAGMCLRLAEHLGMEEDANWLDKEVNGFSTQRSGPLEIRDTGDYEYKSYRKINVKLYIKVEDKIWPEEFSFEMFIGQPLGEIEVHVEDTTEGELVLKTGPLEVMVDIFGADPDEKVPYVVEKTELKRILVGARRELREFARRARKKIKKKN